ncbi:hypothetical protein LTR56_006536 [Elasticomyces elasticus]|nr:hypothetical protein LTR22_022040 [Elasticomyces elasticus]KAK3649949.1 hypothetical protein LTR56_006536 [Elasticomyces elasticus]KAK4931703.1 hypothetical protein LTR49_001768 [Elasticomyces elasticus]KAK5741267.1 hypothetical protein LTS12_024669 [Elasticomyces elasticus]
MDDNYRPSRERDRGDREERTRSGYWSGTPELDARLDGPVYTAGTYPEARQEGKQDIMKMR